MKATRSTTDLLRGSDAHSLADFVMFSQRNLILKLSPALNRGRVSFPQFFLLAYLEEEECLSMSSIARIMGHTTAAATGMVDRLEEHGHLRRFASSGDRRKIMVRITPRGKALVEKMRETIAQDLAKMMAEADANIAQDRSDFGWR